jgi:hypothetical protein
LDAGHWVFQCRTPSIILDAPRSRPRTADVRRRQGRNPRETAPDLASTRLGHQCPSKPNGRHVIRKFVHMRITHDDGTLRYEEIIAGHTSLVVLHFGLHTTRIVQRGCANDCAIAAAFPPRASLSVTPSTTRPCAIRPMTVCRPTLTAWSFNCKDHLLQADNLQQIAERSTGSIGRPQFLVGLQPAFSIGIAANSFTGKAG